MIPKKHDDHVLTRRAVLQRAGRLGVLLGASGGLRAVAGETHRKTEIAETLPALGSRPSSVPVPESAKSTVVHIRASEVLAGRKVHPSLAGEMVEESILSLTGKQTPGEAWHALLKSDDVIGIKLNHVAADVLGTTEAFARQLVESLGRADFSPERIMLIEAPAELARELKTRREVHGWSGKEVPFGSGAEQLAAFLQEVTAIINVPFLKTHNLAGVSGCLKNLSYAAIRRPARYHANGCTPFVGDILALPQIRAKLRLNVVNALRASFDGGPEPRLEATWAHSGVIVGTDPVAVDSVGLDILNEKRLLVKLPQIGDTLGRVPHIHAAALRGVGTDDQDYINLLEPRPF